MICLDYQLAFIHINKNGGTSFEETLRPFETDPDMVENHGPAFQMASILGRDVYEKLETFAIVRNPFDRFVSSYEYRRQKLSPVDAPVTWLPWETSFETFIHEWVVPRPFNRELGPQGYFLNDSVGEGPIVKHIFRFEDGLDQVLASMVRICGLPEGLRLPEVKFNETKRRPWQDYYKGKPELVKIVAERCKGDDRYGYDLDPFA